MAAGMAVPQIRPKDRKKAQVAAARAVSDSASGAMTAGNKVGEMSPAPKTLANCPNIGCSEVLYESRVSSLAGRPLRRELTYMARKYPLTAQM